MIIFAVILLAFGFVALLLSAVYFMSHPRMLFGFNGKTKFTDAVLIKYRSHTTYDNGVSYKKTFPVIRYYNEFQGKDMEDSIGNLGIYPPWDEYKRLDCKHTVPVGQTIQVEYTAKRVRVVDPRFVSKKTFQVGRYLTPLLISGGVVLLAFVLLVIGILMGQ